MHYAGVPCEMDVINDIAKRHNLYVIEDAAQGVGASHKGRPQGALGDIGAFSFHETKNLICGEGGALVVSDPTMFKRAEMVREDGTDRRRFFRGEVDAYSWCTEGSTYAMPDILAAFLYAQLKNMETLTSRRKAIFQLYRQRLEPLAERGLLRLPVIPESGQTNYHMFYIVLECLERRTDLIKHLKSKEVLAVFHYVSLHTSPVGRSLGYREGMLPVTERISDCLLRLPMYYELSDDDVNFISDEVFSYFGINSGH